jgi:hypothetical protein
MADVMQAKNESNWKGKVAENNGKKFRIAAGVTYPGETAKSYGEIKEAHWSNRHSGYKTPTHGMVMTANLYDANPFGERNSWINEKNLPLLMEIFENPEYELNDYEKEYAANFISNGILKKKDKKLYLNMPVFTKAQIDKIDEILAEELKDIAEEYVEKAVEICDRILLPLTREDMMEEYAHWITRGAFSTTMYLFYKNDKLQIPEDYDASAAGLCLYLD